jgi:hypothetical protein
MEIKKSRKLLIKFARQQFKEELKFMDDKIYHCGVRFYSDKMVNDLIESGKSVGGALAELAEKDHRSL